MTEKRMSGEPFGCTPTNEELADALVRLERRVGSLSLNVCMECRDPIENGEGCWVNDFHYHADNCAAKALIELAPKKPL